MYCGFVEFAAAGVHAASACDKEVRQQQQQQHDMSCPPSLRVAPIRVVHAASAAAPARGICQRRFRHVSGACVTAQQSASSCSRTSSIVVSVFIDSNNMNLFEPKTTFKLFHSCDMCPPLSASPPSPASFQHTAVHACR